MGDGYRPCKTGLKLSRGGAMAKILLIDDSWLTRRGLSGMINPMGHEVIEAENGMAGLQSIQDDHPNCIFLDLLMPEMDGYQVLKAIRDKQINVPVIMCTADIQETAKQQCLDLGAFAFLNKPPMEQDVIDIVNKALNQ